MLCMYVLCVSQTNHNCKTFRNALSERHVIPGYFQRIMIQTYCT